MLRLLTSLDTIDLQDSESPSAKDHSRKPTNPPALGDGPPAPHQAVALKSAGLEGLEFPSRSPRASQDLSNKELQLLHEHSDGDDQDGTDSDHGLGMQRNGEGAGGTGQDGELEEDGDDGLDDDLMDKISSSPSIDDGGFSRTWPTRSASLSSSQFAEKDGNILHDPSCYSLNSTTITSSSKFPLSHRREQLSEVHHHGGYGGDGGGGGGCDGGQYGGQDGDQDGGASICGLDGNELELGTSTLNERLGNFREMMEDESYDSDPEGDINLLAPMDDPLLDNSFDKQGEADESTLDSGSDDSFASQDSWGEIGRVVIVDQDDAADGLSFDDSRFTDSGWGGECLRDIEDIDFEFVYALHTFVATVEGQANATKGDTMVLLDDSNSYWWLVRVVKDNSIGE